MAGIRKTRRKNRRPAPMAVPATSSENSVGVRTWGRRALWGLGGAAVLAAAAAVWQVPGLLRQAPQFRLQALEVHGLRLLKGRDLLAISGLDEGTNIYALKLSAVARRLEAHPWVKAAHIQRKPPNRLAVSVVERRRLAWFKAGETYGLDADGVVLPARRQDEEGRADLDLPLISGIAVTPDSVVVGAALANDEVRRLLAWWREATAFDADFCMNVSEIQPYADGDIRLLLVGDGLEVRLPGDRAAGHLGLLRQLMERVYRECPSPSYVDLRFEGQIVVGGGVAAGQEVGSHGAG